MIKKIRFNLDFYNLNAIKKAAEDFKDVTQIEVKDTGEVIFMPNNGLNLEWLESEFKNYVLALLKDELSLDE